MRHTTYLMVLLLAACDGGGSDSGDDSGNAEAPGASGMQGESPNPEAPIDAAVPPPMAEGGDNNPPPNNDPPPNEDPPAEDPPANDPPANDPPPQEIVDECADAGGACDTCACRVCADEIAACTANEGCAGVLDCARRTGCSGLDCLQACGAEIEAAGGAFDPAVAMAQAVSDCRDNSCGTEDAQCIENDPGPPEPPEPPADPMDPPPAPVDECADAGNACDTCACRVCVDELAACNADPDCALVVECARRTGCSGIECLGTCGPEIEAAGGAFSMSVQLATAVSDCRDNRCGQEENQCLGNDPGPPEPPQPPADPGDPMDPPPADECDDAGNACDACACRTCGNELDACNADRGCSVIIECAQRTGCSGVDCLGPCAREINENGGPFGPSVQLATAVNTCRDMRCGMNENQCLENDPGPANPPPPNDPMDPQPPNDPMDPPPPQGRGCDQFPATEFCASGENRDGTEWCEFYIESDRRESCDQICESAGGRCLVAFSDDDGCLPNDARDCDDRARDQICRCSY